MIYAGNTSTYTYIDVRDVSHEMDTERVETQAVGGRFAREALDCSCSPANLMTGLSLPVRTPKSSTFPRILNARLWTPRPASLKPEPPS